MAAPRGQHPGLIRGAPKGGVPGEGPHRLAQSVFPLQVPEHVLGAVGSVLLLQVPQEDPRGYEDTRQGWESPSQRLSRSPRPRLPRAHRPRSPPAAASARPLLMAFPAANSESRTLLSLEATATSGDERGGPQAVIGGRGRLREARNDLPGRRSWVRPE